MKHLPGQKDTSVAWFKLSELIARGECEKALSVFKLLSHSLTDKAYVLQVEGDILWYLDDSRAIEKYRQAAFLYQKEKRIVDALAIYEHLFTQKPQRTELIINLLISYALLDWQEKFITHFDSLLALVRQGAVDTLFLEKACHDVVAALDAGHKPDWLIAFITQHQELSQDCKNLFK